MPLGLAESKHVPCNPWIVSQENESQPVLSHDLLSNIALRSLAMTRDWARTFHWGPTESPGLLWGFRFLRCSGNFWQVPHSLGTSESWNRAVHAAVISGTLIHNFHSVEHLWSIFEHPFCAKIRPFPASGKEGVGTWKRGRCPQSSLQLHPYWFLPPMWVRRCSVV